MNVRVSLRAKCQAHRTRAKGWIGWIWWISSGDSVPCHTLVLDIQSNLVGFREQLGHPLSREG